MKESELLCEVETVMRTVYTMFCHSSNKKQKFKEIAATLEHKAIVFRLPNEARLFSKNFTLNAIVRNYSILFSTSVKSFKHQMMSLQITTKKNLSDPQIYFILEVVNDVSAELAALCKALQTSGLKPIDAMDMTHGKIQKIICQHLEEVPYWRRSNQ